MRAMTLTPPPNQDIWIGVSASPLPVGVAVEWAVRPDCGALVVFSGTARDHGPGRPGVHRLEYEAYEDYVVPALRQVADDARKRWPELGRLVILHRTGVVELGDSAVVVAATSPHRPEAFEAARFCIDTLKHTAPIWKKEAWEGGEAWVRCDHEYEEAVGGAPQGSLHDLNGQERRSPHRAETERGHDPSGPDPARRATPLTRRHRTMNPVARPKAGESPT